MPARQRDFDTVVDTSSAEGKKKKDKRSAKAESALATRRMDEITSVSDFLSGLGESEAWSLQCEPLREDVDVLPWGNATLPPEAFASRRLTDLLDQCRKRYSLILVAGPPISHFADLQMVTARCDGLILQCGASAQAKRYEHYVRELAELEAPLLGIVA
jgi:Mrp family chromosome partitioning ATPase